MTIAVYCGSDTGKGSGWVQAASELGRWIGEGENTLIYGGGEAGLMGAVAREVYEAGREVIGVVPGNVDFIRNRPQIYCTKVIIADNMSTRKETMLELADAFIALPGGIGTLDEISEAITLTKIGVFQKKCVLFNRDSFYEPLKSLFSGMRQAGFLPEDSMDHVLFSDRILEIQAFLK